MLDNPKAFQEAVAAELTEHPDVTEQRITDSADNLTSRGPYLGPPTRKDNKYAVGFYRPRPGLRGPDPTRRRPVRLR